jgi:hypothetical protein
MPAHHQVCLRHGIWLPGPGTRQFSVRDCPDILAAERPARQLLRRCTAEQLIYSRVQAPADQADRAWKRQMMALIESNPRPVTETSPDGLFQAAAYPEAIAAAAGSYASRKSSSRAILIGKSSLRPPPKTGKSGIGAIIH